MAAQITLTQANYNSLSTWSNVTLDGFSTIDASALNGNINITITDSSITFTNPAGNVLASFTNSDLGGGSFSAIVQYIGNDGDSNVSGSTGLDGAGYIGGDDDDTLVDSGSTGGDISGGDGNDTITGGSGNNSNLHGNDGDDIIHGGGGNNNLYGDDGDDTLYADSGSGNLSGGAGNDTIYVGDNTTFVDGGSGIDTMYLPDGATFITWSPGGTAGQVTLANGDTFSFQGIENVFLFCFAKGTRLTTPNDEIPVEELAVGDLVETLDNGAQPIAWIGQRTVPAKEPFAPIIFQKGAIGNKRELRLSPQHRVLVRDWRAELLFGESEVLVAAKHLVNGDTIYSSESDEITYFHILFEKHEIVYSEGALTESFYPGKTCLNGLERDTRDELLALFPGLVGYENEGKFPAARSFLKRFEAKLLTH